MTLDDLKKRLSAATPVQKFFLYVAIPFLLILVFFGEGGSLLTQWSEASKRKTVDDQAKNNETQEATDKTQADKAEGAVEELEKEKDDAVKKTGTEDPATAVNARYGPDGK